MNKKGAVLVIALMILTIVFMIGSMFLFSAKTRRHERFAYIVHKKLFYIAESGIIKAYHMLKKDSFEHRFYLPNKSYTFEEAFDEENYKVSLKDIPGKSIVRIESTAYYKDRTYTIKAEAIFRRKEKVVDNNAYYLKRKIYELWYLKYIK